MRTVQTGIGLALALYICSGAAATVFPTGPAAANNAIPFGNNQVGSQHQVFASTLFSAATGGLPAQITAIALAPGINGGYSGNVTVRLGYTARTPGVGSASGGLAVPVNTGGGSPNASGSMTDFYVNPTFSQTFAGASSSNFQMILTGTPFVYDPALGNLLVEFVVNVPPTPNIDLSLSRAAGGPESSRAYNTTRFGATESPTTALRMDFTFTAVGGGNPGACCFSDGTCQFITSASCSSGGGTFRGEGVSCAAAACPQPGACCSFSGTCTMALQTACTGTFLGGTCATVTCPGVPPVVYSNCNLPTGATTLSGVAAPAGSLWSECADADPPNQAVVQNTIAGFSVSGAFRLADDFVVPAGGLNVAFVKFPVYTTGATTVTNTAVTLQILDGPPSGTPNVVFGDTTTNRQANAEFSNIYRVFNTHNGPACAGTGTAPGTTRRVQWVYAAVNQFLPAGTYWLNWNVTGGTFAPSTTEADAVGRSCGNVVGNGLQLNGTWVAALDTGQGCTLSSVQMDHYFEVLGTAGTPPCYANCDASTTPPVANVADFTCFLQKFAANDPYANCDGSTTPPTINVADFTCFLQKFAAGCP